LRLRASLGRFSDSVVPEKKVKVKVKVEGFPG
jgi:hypothetical protein